VRVKIHTKPGGIPEARVSASPGLTDRGVRQVTVFVSALDAWGMPEVAASIRLSPAEAREAASALIAAADKAEQA